MTYRQNGLSQHVLLNHQESDMAIRPSRNSTLCIVASSMFLLQGCAEVDANLKKTVVIKYAHVANVSQFQGSPDGFNQRQVSGAMPGSFWAIFDVCSIDVQGSGLTEMKYEAGKFVADAGTGTYGPLDPGIVNFAGSGMSSDNPIVLATLRNAFGLAPASQSYPKGFYPSLKSRIAIFIKQAPPGYHGDAIILRYNGQPDVAAIVQNAGDNSPPAVPFYLPGSTPLRNPCP